MTTPIDADYVIAAAAAQGLELAKERAPAVAAQLIRIGEIAAPALALELDVEDEPGPVWRP